MGENLGRKRQRAALETISAIGMHWQHKFPVPAAQSNPTGKGCLQSSAGGVHLEG